MKPRRRGHGQRGKWTELDRLGPIGSVSQAQGSEMATRPPHANADDNRIMVTESSETEWDPVEGLVWRRRVRGSAKKRIPGTPPRGPSGDSPPRYGSCWGAPPTYRTSLFMQRSMMPGVVILAHEGRKRLRQTRVAWGSP